MTITVSTRLQLFGETDAQVIRLSQARHAPAARATTATHRTGIWTQEEHQRFLEGLDLYPTGPWNSVAHHVGTRTRRQVMTHAQKYRQRLQRRANRPPASALALEAPRGFDSTPTTTEVCPQVIAVVVSPMSPAATSEMQLDLEAVALSLPDVLVHDNTAVCDADVLCVQSPPIDLDYGFFNLLSTAPMFDNWEMAPPSVDLEPLEF
ncbi:hypothetical protein PHYBOEH_009986 [Phytophthora boehmeriae]|uniref:Myb-like DNA-binding protein n=1 Tax=Phytophthora boehmeriae TaxID=109152 RepID=A0A8T1X4L3_9STRA|nr:hypothetical protein PHYBOEH_009986 [Phytophthora boehmeriae]